MPPCGPYYSIVVPERGSPPRVFVWLAHTHPGVGVPLAREGQGEFAREVEFSLPFETPVMVRVRFVLFHVRREGPVHLAGHYNFIVGVSQLVYIDPDGVRAWLMVELRAPVLPHLGVAEP